MFLLGVLIFILYQLKPYQIIDDMFIREHAYLEMPALLHS